MYIETFLLNFNFLCSYIEGMIVYIVADFFLLFYYSESLIYATVFFGMPTVLCKEIGKNSFLRENELLSAESEKQQVVMCGWNSIRSKI